MYCNHCGTENLEGAKFCPKFAIRFALSIILLISSSILVTANVLGFVGIIMGIAALLEVIDENGKYRRGITDGTENREFSEI